MGIHYENLNVEVRRFMIIEFEEDQKNQKLYISSRLTEQGQSNWPLFLQEALSAYNDEWLASKIRNSFKTYETKKKPKGGTTEAKVPITAPDTLAEGEFNRFYVRGLCALVLSLGPVNTIGFVLESCNEKHYRRAV